ncbi:MAG: hypothetical protein RL670_759 [Actinomycetota bacterium]
MIAGIGVDMVDLARFERAIERTPRLVERLFASSERTASVRTLAGRFAAKEAFIKALGDPRGLRWSEVTVVNDQLGKPSLQTTGAAAAAMAGKGIHQLHLSITHDGGLACAFVVAEGA